MNIRQLFADEDAVSPVIGVILMVAITVILAAVIGTFVLGLGDQVQSTSPQANFNFDFDTATDQVTLTHDGGDTIADGARLTTTGFTFTASNDWSGVYSGSKVGAGDSITLTNGGGTPANWAGETVRITWTSETGDTSATLGKTTAPTE